MQLSNIRNNLKSIFIYFPFPSLMMIDILVSYLLNNCSTKHTSNKNVHHRCYIIITFLRRDKGTQCRNLAKNYTIVVVVNNEVVFLGVKRFIIHVRILSIQWLGCEGNVNSACSLNFTIYNAIMP